VDSPELADKVGRVFSLNFGLGRYLRRPVSANESPRAVVVEAVMSDFEIAVKGEELLLAEWNYDQIRC
jgi:hypothetical protein